MPHVIFCCRFWSEVRAASHVNQNTTDLLMMPLIWESFSSCCCFRRRSLSSRRFWYCCRILLVCCSCDKSLCSYSSSLRWDIFRRSFKEWISSSYSFTWHKNKSITISALMRIYIKKSVGTLHITAHKTCSVLNLYSYKDVEASVFANDYCR